MWRQQIAVVPLKTLDLLKKTFPKNGQPILRNNEKNMI
jgi:hypothetical protein